MQPADPQPGWDPYDQSRYNQPGYGQMPSYPDPFGPPPQPPQPVPPQPRPPQPVPPQPQPPQSMPPQPRPPQPVPPQPRPPQPVPPQPASYGDPVPPTYWPGGGFAGYGGPPSARSDATPILALIFGILSIPLAVCCSMLGIASGIAGIVLGLLAMRKAEQGLPVNRGQALAGAICGGAGVVLTILRVVLTLGMSAVDLPY